MPPLKDLQKTPSLFFRVNARLRRSWLGRSLYHRRRRREADLYILSFPKAGRTWLRVMLAKALMLHYGEEDAKDYMRLASLAASCPGLPRIKAKHDDDPHFKTPRELVTNKSEYRDSKIILLVRDVADMAVSCYFQLTRREKCFRGSIERYLQCDRGSVDTIIGWYNIWAANRHVPQDLLLVRYEDLHADPAGELRRVLKFIGVEGVKRSVVDEAVAFGRFDNMRDMEEHDALGSDRLRPADPDDPESYKTRRGVIGGYRDYLSALQAQALTVKIREHLDPFYGYQARPARKAAG